VVMMRHDALSQLRRQMVSRYDPNLSIAAV
jgi:hypothetical protein